MSCLIALTVSVQVATAPQESLEAMASSPERHFDAWTRQYKRSYSSAAERSRRLRNFQAHLEHLVWRYAHA